MLFVKSRGPEGDLVMGVLEMAMARMSVRVP